MIDLHTHTTFSDGELIPSELARRAESAGYRAIAFTDHADHSNLDFIVPRIVEVCRRISLRSTLIALPGIEITHVDPEDIAPLAEEARRLGAAVVVVHGETVVEPVKPGTNHAALLASIDILAHPGLISDEDANLAAEKGIALEITTRKGHSLTNGHVALRARKYGAGLVLDNDAHAPGDLMTLHMARLIARGAGLDDDEIAGMFRNSERLMTRARSSQ